MYKLKIKKGVRVIIKSKGITLDSSIDYSQKELENLYNIGLSEFIRKSKPKKNEKDT